MSQLTQTPKRTRRTSPAPARRPPARRPARDRDTEQRILDAAHTVFIRRGTAGARMQEIAAEAGVNQALLHYYFRSKERLSKAAFERAAAEFMPAVLGVLASDATLEAKVTRVIALEIEHLARAPYLPGYIISELTHHPERARQLAAGVTGRTPEEVGRVLLTKLGAQLDAAAAHGSIRQIAPGPFIVNLMSLCIFPFAARPIIMTLLGMDERAFAQFLQRRRTDLTSFFLGALRP